jgi:hypothetical protein
VCSSGPNYGGCIKIGCLAEPVEQLVAEWVIRLLSGPALSAATGEDHAERDLLDRCGSTRTGWRRAAACT